MGHKQFGNWQSPDKFFGVLQPIGDRKVDFDFQKSVPQYIATIIFNGQNPSQTEFFLGISCHGANSFFLAGAGTLFSLPIDKLYKIDRLYTKIYCLTPSEQDFRAS